jgi:hypothetical protein
LKKLGDQAATDTAAVAHNGRLHITNMDNPNFLYPGWESSDAQRLLKIDLAADKQKMQKPKDL